MGKELIKSSDLEMEIEDLLKFFIKLDDKGIQFGSLPKVSTSNMVFTFPMSFLDKLDQRVVMGGDVIEDQEESTTIDEWLQISVGDMVQLKIIISTRNNIEHVVSKPY